MFMTTNGQASVCEYGKPNSCKQDEFCINVDKDITECRPNFKLPLLTLQFPFESGMQIICDQGPLSPPGNSHTWLNTAYALDLQSDRSIKDVPVIAGLEGRVIVYDDCTTENDQCGAGFGNHVKLFADDGYVVLYAHLKSVSVKTGDMVKAGQVIGLEGTTGWAGKDNRHVHLSVHYDWRQAGFEYWKSVGYLPASVPYKLEVCKGKCNQACKSSEVDVRDIQCRRTSNKVKPICGVL